MGWSLWTLLCFGYSPSVITDNDTNMQTICNKKKEKKIADICRRFNIQGWPRAADLLKSKK